MFVVKVYCKIETINFHHEHCIVPTAPGSPRMDEHAVQFSEMIEVMRVVDHVLVGLFGNDVIFPKSRLLIFVFSYTRSRT